MTQKLFQLVLLSLAAVSFTVAVLSTTASAGQGTSVGPMARGWVGVVLGDADSRPGVEVDTVLRRSPAHASGIENGDRILSVNGEGVRTPGKLHTLLSSHPVGRRISLSVERDGETFDVSLQLTPSPSSSEVHRLHLQGFDAPEVSLQNLAGDPVDITAFGDKPVVLEFWATWCSVCRRVSRKLEAALDEAPGRFQVLAITSEDASVVKEHLKTRPMKLDIAIDAGARAHDAFLVNSYPVVVVIGTDGTVSDVATSLNQLDELLENLSESKAESDDGAQRTQ